MQTAELFPREGYHGRSRVELHGARSKRDHTVDKRVVLLLEVHHVTEHVGLGVVLVEHGLVKERSGSGKTSDRGSDALGRHLQLLREGVKNLGLNGGLTLDSAKHVDDIGQIKRTDTFVKGNTDSFVVNFSEVDTSLDRSGVDVGSGYTGARNVNGKGIKEGLVDGGEAEGSKGFREDSGEGVDLAGNSAKTFGPVVDGVHGGHVGEKSLGSAHVGSGLLTSNVLLSGCDG